MKDLIKYIKFCFTSAFMSYEMTNSNMINDVIDDVVDQTLCDINYKFKVKNMTFTKQDILKLIQLDPTLEAVFFYRLERMLFIIDSNNEILPYLASIMKRRTGSEIYYSTSIGRGFNIQHGVDIVIGPRYEIGENFTIHQGVTLGQKDLNSPNEKITIGNNVTIFAGAKILGNISIGDNSKVAANAVVIKNIEANSIYGGIPAKRLK